VPVDDTKRALRLGDYMSMRNGVRALIMMALIGWSRPAAADPIRITGGNMETQIFASLARGLFEGEGFSLTFGADAFAANVILQCSPCTPGATVDLGGTFNFPRASGAALVDGVAYPRIFLEMTGTFTAPPFPINGAETVTRASPFSYSGAITGFVIDPWLAGATEPAFTKTLFGQGTASATFFYVNSEEDGPVFTGNDLRYDFDSATPVPEPATLLLCSAGTAVLALRRRRQRPKTD
jgi:hypothetical protein